MAVIQFSAGALVLRGWRSEDDFSLSTVQADEPVGEATSITPTVDDLTYIGYTTVGTVYKKNLVIQNPPDNPTVALSSDTPSVCDVAQDGTVSVVDYGTCTIRARGQTGSRVNTQTLSTYGAATLYTGISAITAGSLRAYLRDQQLAALDGITPGSSAQRAHATLFTTGTGSSVNTANFIRAQAKAGFDALPLDALDELLVGVAGSVQWRAWISPHHYLTWKGHGVGASGSGWLRFSAEAIVEYSATAWTGTLIKLLPSNWRDYMPDPLGLAVGTEINCWARLYHAHIDGDYRWVQPVRFSGANPYSSGDSRLQFQRPDANNKMAIGGDSGSPVFCGVNGALVALGHIHYGGQVGTIAEFYANWITDINAAMNTLATAASDPAAGTYAVGTVDLGLTGGNFTNYS